MGRSSLVNPVWWYVQPFWWFLFLGHHSFNEATWISKQQSRIATTQGNCCLISCKGRALISVHSPPDRILVRQQRRVRLAAEEWREHQCRWCKQLGAVKCLQTQTAWWFETCFFFFFPKYWERLVELPPCLQVLMLKVSEDCRYLSSNSSKWNTSNSYSGKGDHICPTSCQPPSVNPHIIGTNHNKTSNSNEVFTNQRLFM